MRILPYGEGALLVELEQRIAPEVAARAAAIAEGWKAGPAIPAYASTVLRYDPLSLAHADAERLARNAIARAEDVGRSVPAREVVIPTVYDGPDLEEVARLSGLTAADVVTIHTSGLYRAYFLGFMPGWAYLGPLDPRIRAPRLPTPRGRVPAGSVAVIDGQTGVYPFASPGGWRLIGRTSLRLFDPDADPPTVITAGATVRFVRADT